MCDIPFDHLGLRGPSCQGNWSWLILDSIPVLLPQKRSGCGGHASSARWILPTLNSRCSSLLANPTRFHVRQSIVQVAIQPVGSGVEGVLTERPGCQYLLRQTLCWVVIAPRRQGSVAGPFWASWAGTPVGVGRAVPWDRTAGCPMGHASCSRVPSVQKKRWHGLGSPRCLDSFSASPGLLG